MRVRGVRGGAPRRGGRQRLALDSSTPLRFAQNDTGQGFDEGEASPTLGVEIASLRSQ